MNRPLGLYGIHSYNLTDTRPFASLRAGVVKSVDPRPQALLSMSSSHQKKIIDRYYQHHDTIQSDKLSQIVSDLWLAEEGTNKTRLWGKAQIALMRMGVDANRVARVVRARDIAALAALVAEVDASGQQAPTGAQAAEQDTPKKAAGKAAGKVPGKAPGKAPGAVPVDETRTVKQMQAQKAAEGGYDSIEPDNLKRALKAFRKKLKNARRDDESRLGSRYTTYGKTSSITAITPPNQYPLAVWEKLVELGRLKNVGQGMYELPEG